MAISSLKYFIFSAVALLLVEVHPITGKGGEIKLERVYEDSALSQDDEHTLLFEQKVVVFSNKVEGYQMREEDTVTGIDFKFIIQKYVKAETEECFKLVKISKTMEEKVLDEVKISCEYETPQQPKGSAIRFEAIIFERSPTEVTFVIRDGLCLHRKYDYAEPSNAITKEDILLSPIDCDCLTGRSKEESISGQLPGDAPLLSTDVPVMDQQLGKGGEVKLKRVYDDSALSQADEQTLLFKQKVVVFNKNVEGYQMKEEDTVTGIDFKFIIQKYVKTKPEECMKLIKISKPMEDEVLDEVKISCEYGTPQQPTGSAIRFEAIIFERSPTEVTFVIRDGFCLHRKYDYVEPSNAITKKDMLLSFTDCDTLTGRSKEERISGQLPGEAPLLLTDISVMDEELVVVMKGNVKNFKITDAQSTYKVYSFTITLINHIQGGDCVRVVTLKRSDLKGDFEEVKVSCKIEKPIIFDDEDIILNFGNIMYILDPDNIVFVIKNGVCLQRTYHTQVDRVHHTTDQVLSLPECYQLTRWHWNQRSTEAKLNKQPPPKSLKAPGFMWLLAMGAATDGYKESSETVMKGAQVLNLESRDFFKDEEECLRRLVITVHGVEVERLSASCGLRKNLIANTQGIYYGKAFSFIPDSRTNKFVGLFNVERDGSCLKITYDVPRRNPKKFTKSKAVKTKDLECQNLINGRAYVVHTIDTQPSNSCSSLGWFGGIITKMFSSFWI